MRNSLYGKIFLWFCTTVVVTLIVTLTSAALLGSQPFGRRWMAMTQDLYAHSAVDFYETGGNASLQRYLDTLRRSSTVEGQLLDDTGRDVLGRPTMSKSAAVLARAKRTGQSCVRLGWIWSGASPVNYAGKKFIFLMVLHPGPQIFDGTFARAMLPRLGVGVMFVALCCLLLARHITRPILVLEQAASALAAGALSVRALPKMDGRTDELARMASAFDHMAERIQMLIQTQKEMLGHISHELRSPLTRIGVSLELLRRGESESLEQMQADLDRLNQMIGEILELTRMDLQRGVHVASERVQLGETLNVIVHDASFETQGQGQRLMSDIDSHCTIIGNSAMLRSCFENIVRNALLYTTPGTPIRIVLRCHKNTAEILIEDEGDGVPAEALPRLFEMFYRVASLSDRHPKGTGSGLAIAKRIVEMHGGTIAASHVQPHGLAIRIVLPRVLS